MHLGLGTDNPLERSFQKRDLYDESQEDSLYSLLVKGKSIVILGEPGIGKTFCLKQIKKSCDEYIWVPPAPFIRNPHKFKPKNCDQYLVIDGIDELAALQDTDVLHSIMKALESIDSPKFVISCRSAEWKHVSSSLKIENDYDDQPVILTLQGITREQATEYLSGHTTASSARTILDQLDNASLQKFYQNPLHLIFVTKIMSGGENISVTGRFELYDNVSRVLLSEYINARAETSRLGKLSIDESLDSAGAICASMLVTGKAFVTSNQSMDKQGRDYSVDISEIVRLPNAGEAEDVLNSPLFKVADDKPGYRMPYHRSLAEFLAARWIANTLRDRDLARNRFVQSIMVEAQFPASLRGMFAWLALHEEFTDKVIETDPYGLLLYSDIKRLPSKKIRKLINQLMVLDQKSPSFRSEDWSEYVPPGLVREDTIHTVKKVIVNENIGSQLKQLLIEAIKNSKHASVFMNSLPKILHNLRTTYSFRLNVLEILLEISKDVQYWTNVIESLRKQKFSDSTEICIYILDEVGADKFSQSLICECILANTGFIRDRDQYGRVHTSSVSRLSNHFDVDNSVEILDRVSSGVENFLKSQHNNESYSPSWKCISSFGYPLLERIYKAKSIDFGQLVYWNKYISLCGLIVNRWRKGLNFLLYGDTEFRRGLQSYLISNPDGHSHLELFRFRFGEISDGLVLTFYDICFHIAEIVEGPGSNENDGIIWTALVNSRFSFSIDEIEQIAELSKPLVEQNNELQQVLAEQRSRSSKANESSDSRQFKSIDTADDRKSKSISERRELIQANIEAFENGSIQEVSACAKDYLGIDSYQNYQSSPHERVSSEIGSDLLPRALKGFRAVLNKNDLPTSEAIANSYSRRRTSSYVYPILATLNEYLNESVTFAGISDDILLVGFYALKNEWAVAYSIREKLYVPLKEEVFRRFEEKDVYLKWMEPRIKNGSFDCSDFRSLTDNYQNPSVVIPIVEEWIESHDNFSASDTKKLISELLFQPKTYSTSDKERLLNLGLRRLSVDNGELVLFWASVVFCLDFESFCQNVPSSLKSNSELIWHIRDTSTKQIYTDQDMFENVDLKLTGFHLHWIISSYRKTWTYIEYWRGPKGRDRDPWDASQYLQSCIKRLGTEVDEDSHKLLDDLVSMSSDGYYEGLMTAQSRQKRARIEHNFQPLTLKSVKNLLNHSKPSSEKDLQTLFLAYLDKLQSRLNREQVDTVKRFYTDSGVPRNENDCRDLIISLLDESVRFDLKPEYVATSRTRADLGVIFRDMSVPVEIKGQWNRNLWYGLNVELETNYVKDYKFWEYGVYLVLWFGRSTCKGRYLKHQMRNRFFPAFKNGPTTASELNFLLTEEITEGSRDSIRVFVLDLEIKSDRIESC